MRRTTMTNEVNNNKYDNNNMENTKMNAEVNKMKTILKNTFKFKVLLNDDYKGEVWEQEYIKPILTYAKFYNSNGKLTHTETRPTGSYDLFNEEVLNTFETYAVESESTKDEVLSKFRNDGSVIIFVDFGIGDGEDWKVFNFYEDRDEGRNDYPLIEKLFDEIMEEF